MENTKLWLSFPPKEASLKDITALEAPEIEIKRVILFAGPPACAVAFHSPNSNIYPSEPLLPSCLFPTQP